LRIISCDGASDFLYRHKVIPDYIIGDLDAIKPETLAYYKKKKVVVKKIADQNSNDLEKAIKLAISKNLKNISIIGFTGRRYDHALNNLSIIKRYYKKAKIRIYDNQFEMFIISKSYEFNCKKGDVVSLIPLPEANGVKTTGLKYPLNRETLVFGKREGALNETTGNYVRIEVRIGELLVCKSYSSLRAKRRESL
jgi:thiamine pyrophosphokinase